jgi:tetratricopeptide (TPR) repeat protein
MTLALVVSGWLWAAPASAALTEGARLAAVYDTILQANFDQVAAQLDQTCPPAPEEACRTLEVVSIWWEILLNPQSRLLDGRFEERVTAAIATNDAWTKREPQRGEAWFYLAGSYAPLVQWRVLRGERVAAARDGKRIKDALERALELDPSLNDAFFGIGLYHYYADVAPIGAKLVRWLMFLPGGDRTKGLQEMLQARDHGELLKGEADYQIQLLYLWYEKKPTEALALLEGLEKRYPANPLFLERIADVQSEYFHDHPASATAWQKLLDQARSGRVNAAGIAEVRAQIGLAAELDAMFETDRAVDRLNELIDQKPLVPYGARAEAELRLGLAYDRLGRRDRAAAAYSQALSHAPADDPDQIRARTRAAMRGKPDARLAEAYRESLEGWRDLEHREIDRAEEALAHAIASAPESAAPEILVMRYRYAKALEAHGDRDRAIGQLEQVIAPRAVMAPAIVLASAYVDYGKSLERLGDRAKALEMYRYAVNVIGGEPHARHEAARAIKRLASPTAHARTPVYFFDFLHTFVLDTGNFSTIIYIWYEDGKLRPSLVRSVRPRPSESRLRRGCQNARRHNPERNLRCSRAVTAASGARSERSAKTAEGASTRCAVIG